MGKFILSVQRGCYTFYFTAANGDRIAESAPHITRSAAQHALDDARKCSKNTDCYLKKETEGSFYFELKNKAGAVLVRSENFQTPETRDYAITIMQREVEMAGATETI